MSAQRNAVTWGLVGSLCVHIVLAIALTTLPSELPPPLNSARALAIAPTPFADPELAPSSSRSARAADHEIEVLFGGFESAQNVDTSERGAGGDALGAVHATRLATRDDRVQLQDSTTNSPDENQVQRIRTARDRASWENRRATPNPDLAHHLASGSGTIAERRQLSRRDPRSGVERRGVATQRGDGERSLPPIAGQQRAGDTAALPQPREQEQAGSVERPGAGVARARGRRFSRSANSAFARPDVDEGPAAAPAESSGRVRDNRNSELLAAQLAQDVVDATRRGGRAEGEGSGGVGGGGAAGSGGGAVAGGRANGARPGPGQHGALDTRDPRYVRWFNQQKRKLSEALTYPRERRIARDQGVAVFRVTFQRSGAVLRARLVRSTGFADLDAAARRAFRRARFSPMPADVLPGQSTPTVRFTVDFENPMFD